MARGSSPEELEVRENTLGGSNARARSTAEGVSEEVYPTGSDGWEGLRRARRAEGKGGGRE